MIHKALTLTQPWATLVMLGEKRVETRWVLYKHRGPLHIHAALRGFDQDAWNKLSDPFLMALDRHGILRWDQLPLGKVLGSVDVVDGCRFSGGGFPECLPESWRGRCGDWEPHFGDYSVGRGGLLLENPRPLAVPVAARGMNGLWNWEDGK